MGAFTGFFIELSNKIFTNLISENRYKAILNGLAASLQLTAYAAILGIVLGLFVAIFRIRRIPVFTNIFESYVSVIRGTPANIQLIVIYFVILASSKWDPILIASIAFGINSGAYVSEIIRGGILSVDKGQMEASRSLGLSYGKSMQLVIIPQAIKNILPALGNEFIILLKETSIAGYIGVSDLARAGMSIRSATYDSSTSLIIIAYIYFILTVMLSKLLKYFEGRMRASD